MLKIALASCLIALETVSYCKAQVFIEKKVDVQLCDSSHVFISKCVEGIDDNFSIRMDNGATIIKLSSLLNNTSRRVVYQDGNCKMELIFMETGRLKGILRYRKLEGRYRKDGDWVFFNEKDVVEQISTWRNDILIRTTNYNLSSKKRVYNY